MHVCSSKNIGELVQLRRKALGMTRADCAAWCDVGPRFMFDLEHGKASVHFDKVLSVLSRLGIRLAVVTSSGVVQTEQDRAPFVTSTISAPGFDGADWLTARAIGYYAASACHIPVCSQTFDRDNDRIGITMPPALRPLFEQRGQVSLREEHGGPGFNRIFTTIDAVSTAPMDDVRSLLRWAIFTFLVGDVSVSAADLRMDAFSGRLAPFGLIACASGEIAADRVFKGLRIGREWPNDWLRVDHWADFASAAGVKASVVLELMSEMAISVPAAVRSAAETHTRSKLLRGAASTIVSIATARGERMKELMLSAGHQKVPGLKRSRAVSSAGA